MGDDAGRPRASYRFLARAGTEDATWALSEILAVIEEHGVVIQYLVMRRTPTDSRHIEVEIDADIPNGPLSVVLLGLAACESIAVISAENLNSRSTFILPI